MNTGTGTSFWRAYTNQPLDVIRRIFHHSLWAQDVHQQPCLLLQLSLSEIFFQCPLSQLSGFSPVWEFRHFCFHTRPEHLQVEHKVGKPQEMKIKVFFPEGYPCMPLAVQLHSPRLDEVRHQGIETWKRLWVRFICKLCLNATRPQEQCVCMNIRTRDFFSQN